MKVNCGTSTSSNQTVMGNTLCSWEAPEVISLDIDRTESGTGTGHEKTNEHYADGPPPS
jgi:hypothetical protein